MSTVLKPIPNNGLDLNSSILVCHKISLVFVKLPALCALAFFCSRFSRYGLLKVKVNMRIRIVTIFTFMH